MLINTAMNLFFMWALLVLRRQLEQRLQRASLQWQANEIEKGEATDWNGGYSVPEMFRSVGWEVEEATTEDGTAGPFANAWTKDGKTPLRPYRMERECLVSRQLSIVQVFTRSFRQYYRKVQNWDGKDDVSTSTIHAQLIWWYTAQALPNWPFSFLSHLIFFLLAELTMKYVTSMDHA